MKWTTAFLVVVCVSITAFYYPSAKADAFGLPGPGENITINADRIITIPVGQNAALAGILTIAGTETAEPVVQIVISGSLTVEGSITCTKANLTLQNFGVLTFQNAQLFCKNGGILNIVNNGSCSSDSSLFDSNSSGSVLSFVNGGNMKFQRSEITAEHDAKVDIDGIFGDQEFTDCILHVWRRSEEVTSPGININNGYTNWSRCQIINEGNFNYQNNGFVRVTDCNISSIAWGTTNLLNNGVITFTRTNLISQGAINVGNAGQMALYWTTMSSSVAFHLQNSGNLIANFWTTRTTGALGQIEIVNLGAMKLNRPFIQNTVLSDLTSLETKKTFAQTSGGGISVDNQKGSITAGPNLDSCDSTASKKDSFATSDSLYVQGSGFSTSATIPFYVVPDVVSWTNVAPIPGRVEGTATTIQTDAQGNLPVTQVWGPPLKEGRYDLVLDVNGNGQYDQGVDVLDDYDVAGTAGIATPELSYYAVGVLVILATTVILMIQKRKGKHL